MKAIMIFALSVVLAIGALAQGNLQFNQVIYQEISLTVAVGAINPQTQITFTVPSGKVWKIESAFACTKSYSTSSSYPPGAYGLFGDDVKLAINERIIYNNSSSSNQGVFPVWLPAGTYTLTLVRTGSVSISGANPAYYNGSISAIEFNITP